MEWLSPVVGELLGQRGVLLQVADVPHLIVGGLALAAVLLLRKQSGSS